MKREQRKVIVIGAGFAGLAAACDLSAAGFEVCICEQHLQAGGRARVWEQDGFRFDMGPSWYWMPDLFEQFFSRFGKSPTDYYELVRLDPAYQIFFEDGYVADIPAGLEERRALIEEWEPGVGKAFDQFLKEARYMYDTATQDYLLRPSLSLMEFFDIRLVKELYRLKMLSSIHRYVRRFFRHSRTIQLMEWPVLFLGASAAKTSAMYSLMTYADIALGTWYPKGGMHKVIEALVSLAKEEGATFHLGQGVKRIRVDERDRVVGVTTSEGDIDADYVVAAADYHHVEQHLLEPKHRQYSNAYWDKRVMSPSSLLFYLGLSTSIPELHHHNLFFDRGMEEHLDAVYHRARWPDEPLFYACAPSRTEPSCAPPGHENLFLLIPLAPGLRDDSAMREVCFDKVMARLEQHTGRALREHIVLKRSYAMNEFIEDYNAHKGNAYGMANTLLQTGPLKPKLRSNRVSGLYFAGQLTVPGPGMPPSLVSGQLASQLLQSDAG